MIKSIKSYLKYNEKRQCIDIMFLLLLIFMQIINYFVKSSHHKSLFCLTLGRILLSSIYYYFSNISENWKLRKNYFSMLAYSSSFFIQIMIKLGDN